MLEFKDSRDPFGLISRIFEQVNTINIECIAFNLMSGKLE